MSLLLRADSAGSKSDLSIWNSFSAAISAMVCPFVDIRRDCRIAAAWFDEDWAARE